VIFVLKIYVGSKKPNKTRFEVGFFGWVFLGFIGRVFLGGFFIANPGKNAIQFFQLAWNIGNFR
jgi:hypothetical protein